MDISQQHPPRQSRRGRPSKGPRVRVEGRVHPRIAALFDAEAKRTGISQSDLLAGILAARYSNIPQTIPHEELPKIA
jgi:hypothetical protein